MKDLLILVADQNSEFVLRELLKRLPKIETIPEFTFEIIRHPRRDPGVVNQAVEFVRPFIGDYRYLLIMFDHEGSGKESLKIMELEAEMEDKLNNNGWQNRNTCVILKPELESWLWVNSIILHEITEWGHEADIYALIKENGFQFHSNSNKPIKPKEAFEFVLKQQKIARSSSLYAKIAQKASYKTCVDSSFKKFIKTIKIWFSEKP